MVNFIKTQVNALRFVQSAAYHLQGGRRMKSIHQRTKKELEIIKAFLEDYDLWGDKETYTIAKTTLQEQINNVKEDKQNG